MNRYKELSERVISWANSKGILEKATPLAQIRKTLEEVEETELALLHQQLGNESYTNIKGALKDTKEEILDGFGDTLVTILIGCKLQNINPLDALQSALNIIEKRTGKMIDGVFIKD